jgi:hypothetical protein
VDQYFLVVPQHLELQLGQYLLVVLLHLVVQDYLLGLHYLLGLEAPVLLQVLVHLDYLWGQSAQ